MIRQDHRFHGQNAIARVYRHGRSARGANIAVKYGFNPRQRLYRAAVVVSRKVHKSAVVRNRIRRRIFEAIRGHEAIIPVGVNLVFTVYDEMYATMDYADLSAEIARLISKMKESQEREG